MSDSPGIRHLAGNSRGPAQDRERASASPSRRRLVEECEIVCIWAVQRAFGKRALITAIRQARPFRLPVPGGYFDIWLVDEAHRLPGGVERWSSIEDGTARLWLLCPGCRRKVAKLFYYILPGSSGRSDLLCRGCHRLAYLRGNCGGNRWYREPGKPIRRLLQEKNRLLSGRPGPRVEARLAQIDQQIEVLKQKLKPKHRTRCRRNLLSLRQKRPYRDASLLQ